MFIDRVIHFVKKLILGDQVKGPCTEMLKALIAVLYVAHLIVQVLSFNMNLFLLRIVFPDRVIHFGENLGDQVKVRFRKS